MLLANEISSQQSADIFGGLNGLSESKFRLSGFENNPSNANDVKDWEFGLSFGGSLAKKNTAGIYFLSIAKRIGPNYFYGRFSPGIKKEFNFKSGTKIKLQGDIEVEQELQTTLKYEEVFGVGYSFTLLPELTAGFNLRYFGQQFSEEKPDIIFSDTLNSVSITNLSTDKNFWSCDFGISYKPITEVAVNISSINLITAYERSVETGTAFEMKREKGAAIGLSLSPVNTLNLFAAYETTNSFSAGINGSFSLLGGKLSIGAAALHDKYQKPFLAGIIPAINFSSDFYSVTLSGVKYFSDRTKSEPLSEFLSNGINNVFNNPYSYDKIFLTLNMALSFIPDQKIKFIDLLIEKEIYPALAGEYQKEPFAVARVVNLSGKRVTVKPSSFIPRLNIESVYSPQVEINGGDTASVYFFTIIDEDITPVDKREIVQTHFYISSDTRQNEDRIQKPLLVNDKNSWDGKITNLRYFAKEDYTFSFEYARRVISLFKVEIENRSPELRIFEKAKILFNHFVKEMVYVADPRASVERVQFPQETFSFKGGDCDDLSVAYSSLLESVGIQTAFVDYKSDSGISHVNLLINTEIKPEESGLISINDKKYFTRKNISGTDEIWLPVETTSLTNFDTAWNIAAEKFFNEAIENLGLSKRTVEIVDIY